MDQPVSSSLHLLGFRNLWVAVLAWTTHTMVKTTRNAKLSNVAPTSARYSIFYYLNEIHGRKPWFSWGLQQQSVKSHIFEVIPWVQPRTRDCMVVFEVNPYIVTFLDCTRITSITAATGAVGLMVDGDCQDGPVFDLESSRRMYTLVFRPEVGMVPSAPIRRLAQREHWLR